MNQEEKYFARILFKLKVHQNDGQAYENFFVQIMQYQNSNFRPIKPQGQFGDRKNDGFDKIAGKYYQVYAPENIDKSQKNAIDKLKEDFMGLYNFWNGISPIKDFFFVINDKYKGAFASLEKELNDIESTYKVCCNPFLVKDLEDIFINLKDNEIFSVLNSYIPSTNDINTVDYSIMTEVVEYLMNYESPYSYNEEKIVKPDFENKIIFNNLGENVKNLLITSSYQSYVLDDYFSLNSNFMKNELRNKFNKIYNEGLQTISFQENKNDLVFFFILDKATPNKKKAVQDTVLVLMSYYFEYCDIFESVSNGDKK